MSHPGYPNALQTGAIMQRLGEAVVTSLPYHPEYIDQGTVFDTALLEPVSLLT